MRAQIAIRFDQGRLDELSDVVEQSAAAIPGGEGRVIRALYYSEVGFPGDAGRLIEMDAANGFSAFPFDVTWTSCMAIYAQVAATVRNERAAARLVEQIEPWRDQIATSGTSIWNGSIAHALGLALATIQHYDDAEDAFAEAARSTSVWVRRSFLREHASNGPASSSLATARATGRAPAIWPALRTPLPPIWVLAPSNVAPVLSSNPVSPTRRRC